MFTDNRNSNGRRRLVRGSSHKLVSTHAVKSSHINDLPWSRLLFSYNSAIAGTTEFTRFMIIPGIAYSDMVPTSWTFSISVFPNVTSDGKNGNSFIVCLT
jgi:hypothetical protein